MEPGWEKQETVSSQLFEGVCNNVVVWKIFLKTIKERDAVRTNSVTYLNEITFEFEKTLYEVRSKLAQLLFLSFPPFCHFLNIFQGRPSPPLGSQIHDRDNLFIFFLFFFFLLVDFAGRQRI